jgi:predicted transporter
MRDSIFLSDLVTWVIALGIFVFGLWAGVQIDKANMQERMDTAINNAVSHALETYNPLSCKEQNVIKAIKDMSANGIGLDTYTISVYLKSDGEN